MLRASHYRTHDSIQVDLVALMLTALLACTGPDARAALQKIEICAVEWRPYTSRSMEGHGIAAQMATEVFNSIGYAPSYVFTSTRTCERYAADNETNNGIRGALGFFQSKKRKAMGLVFSDALFDVEEVVFYNKTERPELRRFEIQDSLAGYTAAFVEAYAHTTAIEQTLTNRASQASDFEAFDNLVNAEIDLVPSDYTVGIQILRNYFPRRQFDIGVLAHIRATKSVHFMVSERNPHNRELLRRFNQSLRSSKKSSDFTYRIKAMQEDARPVVKLVGNADGLVKGRDVEDPATGYLLPRGTVAEIERWAPDLVTAHDWPPKLPVTECTTVRIINGPHSGRLLCVDSRHISLP